MAVYKTLLYIARESLPKFCGT